ncbi:MAG: 2-oxo acid dehydrogenase subunit E2 [Bacteriovoracaceae bacterium]|nr:2-oxo acid dehydrogenase subunit E2 [Bacteriovoracaceae bacterium]
MGKIRLTKVKDTAAFRKIAMGTWKTAKDPSVYGLVEIDMQPVLEKLPEYSKKNEIKITPAHLVGKAVAYCMQKRPEINGLIRGSRIYLREEVSLFYQVAIPAKGPDRVGKANLAGTVIHGAEKMTTAEISKSLREKSLAVRDGKDKEIAKSMDIFKWLPWWASKYYLNIASWLLYGLNLDLSFLGMPKDPFGSVMVTNVGGLGIDIAWAPLCPYTRVPLLLAVGAISEKAWVVDGKIEVRPIMPIAVTFDHRLIDGIHAAQMAKDFKELFANPESHLLAD